MRPFIRVAPGSVLQRLGLPLDTARSGHGSGSQEWCRHIINLRGDGLLKFRECSVRVCHGAFGPACQSIERDKFCSFSFISRRVGCNDPFNNSNLPRKHKHQGG